MAALSPVMGRLQMEQGERTSVLARLRYRLGAWTSNNQSSNNKKRKMEQSHKCGSNCGLEGECHIKGRIELINHFECLRFKIKHEVQ